MAGQPHIMCRGNNQSNQGTSNGTHTQLEVFDHVISSNGLTWDSTEHHVTVPIAGRYLVYSKVNYGTQYSDSNDTSYQIRLNDAYYGGNSDMWYFPQGSSTTHYYEHFIASAIVNAAANDEISFWFKQATGGTRVISGSMCSFYIYLLG